MGLAAEYLIVGARASGLAFADTLVARSEAEVLIVDKRHEPGGHLCDTYPFVQLHTASHIYGVDSLPLGDDRLQVGGANDGFYEQATGAEVQEYLRRVQHDVLEPTGQVRFLGGHEHLGGSGGQHVVRDLTSGEELEVGVRRSLVDATYLESEIPVTHTPSFTVAADRPAARPGRRHPRASLAGRRAHRRRGRGAACARTCSTWTAPATGCRPATRCRSSSRIGSLPSTTGQPHPGRHREIPVTRRNHSHKEHHR